MPATEGPDTLNGTNQNEDTINGLGGDDSIRGFGSDDWLIGGEGDDTLVGGGGVGDILEGGAGDDVLNGGGGNPGQPGSDIAFYGNAPGAVTVNLNLTNQNTGSAGFDRLINIEGVTGSGFDDLLIGNDQSNATPGGTNTGLRGLDGDDTIKGLGGEDDLEGDAGDDSLLGGQGNDLLDPDGSSVGDDYVNGGPGSDVLSYLFATAGVTVDLRLKAAQDTGGAGTDVILSIETVNGSQLDDALTGNGLANGLIGFGGDDTLAGAAGDDALSGNDGDDVLNGGAGDDTLSGSSGFDRLTGGLGADTVVFIGASDSSVGAEDRITGFSSVDGDVVRLDPIDAVTGGTDDAFTFIGSNPFSGAAGELRFVTTMSGNGLVSGDVNGDGDADFRILLLGVTTMSAGDFEL